MKNKKHPEHKCLGCTRMTTNLNYCDTCQKISTANMFCKSEMKITAPVATPTYRFKGINYMREGK